MTTEVKKQSKVELIKEDSEYLKGNIAQELADESTPNVSDASYELLKFHGSYQGYNRDTATARKKAKLDKEWEFMLRMKCPAGRLTSEQYLAIDTICDDYANGTMRITTRQTFQFHCIVKGDLKKHIAALDAISISTLGGCGDVVRNVMCSAAPYKDKKHKKILEDTFAIAKHCAPKTSAFHEIWIDGKNVNQSNENEIEPLYGKYYMPRKFKIGLITPDDNSIDVFTHDLGFVLIYDGDEFLGYNVCVGGGLGMTHNKPKTYPRLATPIAFIKPDQLLKMTESVVKLQCDHGDRSDRKHARLKYVVEENGLDWTRKTLAEYFGEELTPPVEVKEYAIPDHMGWHKQGDGKWFLGIPIDSGRIKNDETTKIRAALYTIIKQYQPNVILTAEQNIILADIDGDDIAKIEILLKKYDISLREDMTDVQRYALACVALPTCGKALAEAERVQIPLIKTIEDVMDKHGIKRDRVAIRIAGCPNGCSRPYVGDIGIVGRTPDHYALFIGGDFEGTRLNSKILDRVPYDNLGEVFDFMFSNFVKRRDGDEGFGDYANRFGVSKIASEIEEKFKEIYKWAKAA